MKPKRKLKRWVKVVLLLIPEAVIICQLFFIGFNICKINRSIENKPDIIIYTESRCYHG